MAAEVISGPEVGMDDISICTVLTLTPGSIPLYGIPPMVQLGFVGNRMYIRNNFDENNWWPWETVANMSAVEEAIAAA